MTYQVTAPRLLFLYPRVARLSLSPDTRGQLIFPHLIEQDKVTTLTQCKGKRSRRNCNQPLGDATDTIGSGGSFTKSNNGKARCTASGARMCPSSWRLGFRERSGSTRAGGISKEKRIHTSAGCQQSIKPKRYGTANEPPPYLENSKRKDENGRRRVKKEAEERGQKRGANDNAEEKEGSTKKDTTAIKGGAENRDGKNNQRVSRTAPGRQHLYRADGRLVETNLDNEGDADEESPVVHEKSQAQILQSKQTGIGNNIDSSNGADHLQTHRETNDDYTTQEALLQTFLQAQPSEMLDKASQQLLLRNNRDAHLSSSNSSPASHFHHFDTYTMARNLQDGGFSEKQAVTTMKAMRVTLAENLDWAKKGLVSKSNVENVSSDRSIMAKINREFLLLAHDWSYILTFSFGEQGTYLFRAACSELRTEVQHNRKKAADRMRNERNQLEREAEILNQRFQQESQNLKDELRGMFDDRKMAVRMDQKAMESKVRAFLN